MTLPTWKRVLLRLPPLARIAAREGAMRQRIAELEAKLAAPPSSPSLPFAFGIDHLWCDLHGIHLWAWIDVAGEAVTEIALCSGDARVAIAPPPPAPDCSRQHVRLTLACAPFRAAFLEMTTGARTERVSLADSITKQPQPGPKPSRAIDAFITAMKARHGRVLELGARIVGAESFARDVEFTPECTYVGCDIHAAPGIDLVADAHTLSSASGRGVFDGIFSIAVLEHLAAPWLAAAEINRALKPGGLTFHVTHQTYPVHERPNDFWRFSDEALRVLFGPATGFEVVDVGMRDPVFMAPDPSWRHDDAMVMTSQPGFARVYVLARKVSELPDGSLGLPDRLDLGERSRAYPNHDL